MAARLSAWARMQVSGVIRGYGEMSRRIEREPGMLSDRTIETYLRQTAAVRRALGRFDDTERRLIHKSLFEGVPLAHIDAPFALRTMQRLRAAFLRTLAAELGLRGD